MADSPICRHLLFKYPATPGQDFSGTIITPADGSDFVPGQRVFGVAGKPWIGGGLAEYASIPTSRTTAVPNGVSLIDAATIGIAGTTAYKTIVPYVKNGDRVFLNGGSGGVGMFGIQIAKAVGCHVTSTCSTANVELCKRLGADVVIDYTKEDVVEALKTSRVKMDHVVDNVWKDPGLYWRCHEYMKAEAHYIVVAGSPALADALVMLKVTLWPSFLGGGRRKIANYLDIPRLQEMEKVVELMKEGKVKPVIDSRFPFDEAPQSYEKLMTGRAKGKIIVDGTGST